MGILVVITISNWESVKPDPFSIDPSSLIRLEDAVVEAVNIEEDPGEVQLYKTQESVQKFDRKSSLGWTKHSKLHFEVIMIGLSIPSTFFLEIKKIISTFCDNIGLVGNLQEVVFYTKWPRDVSGF